MPYYILLIGRCVCEVGFSGNRCDRPCAKGFYGIACKQVCPPCTSGKNNHFCLVLTRLQIFLIQFEFIFKKVLRTLIWNSHIRNNKLHGTGKICSGKNFFSNSLKDKSWFFSLKVKTVDIESLRHVTWELTLKNNVFLRI